MMQMTTRMIEQDFGVEINDFDVKAMSSEDIHLLMPLLHRSKLLLFRSQELDPHSLLRFSEWFGRVQRFEGNNAKIRQVPEIFVVSNDENVGLTDVGQYWHQDGSFLSHPCKFSIYYAVETPHEGHATRFQDAVRAYRDLPIELKEIVDSKSSRHSLGPQIKNTHPLVGIHEGSGAKFLYANLGMGREIPGMSQAEQDKFFVALEEFLSGPTRYYEHCWKAGDLVVLSHFGAMHRALPAKGKSLRIIHRTTVL